MSRAHLTIATGIANHGLSLDVRRDVELVKAGVMYADDVELLSLGSQALYSLDDFSSAGPDGLVQLLAALPNESWVQLGTPPGQGDTAKRLFANLPALQAASSATGDPAFTESVRQMVQQLDASSSELREFVSSMLNDSGANELASARRRGVLRINDRVRLHGDTTIADFTSELKERVEASNRMLLVDELAAGLVRHMIEEGVADPPPTALANASEVLVGGGMVARLPYFPDAPLDELLDMREDLQEPLVRYRRAVSELQSRLAAGPFDRDASGDLDRLWRMEVEPSLLDVKKEMADHGLIREVLRLLGRDPKSLLAQVAPGAATSLIVHADLSAGSLETLVAGALTTAVTTGVMAVQQRIEHRTAIRRGDLYYLAELGHRMNALKDVP